MPGVTATLAEALPLLRPALPPVLVGEVPYERISRLARVLGPTWWGGFEVELNAAAAGSDRVDFHQGATGPADIPLMLDAPVTRLNPGDRQVWERFARLGGTWSDARSTLHRAIARLGLEFDLNDPAVRAPIPAVFWSFTEAGDDPGSGTDRFALSARIHGMLTPDRNPARLHDQLSICRDALPAEAELVHAGTMISRDRSGLRVNIWGLAPAGIEGVLDRCGAPPLAAPLLDCLRPLQDQLDSMILALDLTARGPVVNGLECLPRPEPGGGLDWPSLIGNLVESGLCDRQKGAALLLWPGRTAPSPGAAAWPTPLMIASLLGEPREFSFFRRRLNHIKLSLREADTISCKAYLEFYHERVAVDPAPAASGSSPASR